MAETCTMPPNGFDPLSTGFQDKPVLDLEILASHGFTENCLDRTISMLEKIAELLNTGKCGWTRTDKCPSKVNRLKFAAKKLTEAQISVTEQNRVQRRMKGQLGVRNISDDSGIARLRNLRAARMEQLYDEKSPPPKILWNDKNLDENQNPNDNDTNSNSNPEILTPDPENSDTKFYKIPQSCYVCKLHFTEIHSFYDQLCPPCAAISFSKRDQSADLSGKTALVTGGRIKIGYEIVLRLLRCGTSRVITTTRFPNDAAKRFANEPDFDTWKSRLDIYGLDLRFLGHVESFCAFIEKTYSRLDILIQNAAQTVRRPPAFYAHLIQDELHPVQNFNLVKTFPKQNDRGQGQGQSGRICGAGAGGLLSLHARASANVQDSASALSTQLMVHPEDGTEEHYFPSGQYDSDHQQIDLRVKNSWILEVPEVDMTEMVEVSIVNSIAPFVILSKLTPLMKKTRKMDLTSYGWIILVSALEGQFYREKSSRHPHTNCAKASLNMLARTSGQYYAKFNLLLNSVDTGWVTNEDPVWLRQRKEYQRGFVPPLDEIDGAVRILDPIFMTINHGVTEYGKFYKDFKETVW